MNLQQTIADWPANAEGEIDWCGIANFCATEHAKLSPEMALLSLRVQQNWDRVQECILAMLENGASPDHPAIEAMTFALGVLNIRSAEVATTMALQALNEKPVSEWIPPDQDAAE